jgi:3-hydroxyacyl-[acyl-carrier-protein] dehydratase
MIVRFKNLPTERIMTYIPHRPPFLFVDEIKEIEVDTECISNSYVIGTKKVLPTEPYLKGHFPFLPIMPGVLALEGAMQTACVAFTIFTEKEEVDFNDQDSLPFFVGADKMRLKKPIFPGETIEYHIQYDTIKRGFVKSSAIIKKEDVVCANFVFTVFLRALSDSA